VDVFSKSAAGSGDGNMNSSRELKLGDPANWPSTNTVNAGDDSCLGLSSSNNASSFNDFLDLWLPTVLDVKECTISLSFGVLVEPCELLCDRLVAVELLRLVLVKLGDFVTDFLLVD